MGDQYTYEELVERVIELENSLLHIQREMNGYIKAKDFELRAVYNSFSWRITKPLRIAKKVFNRVRNKFFGR